MCGVAGASTWPVVQLRFHLMPAKNALGALFRQEELASCGRTDRVSSRPVV